MNAEIVDGNVVDVVIEEWGGEKCKSATTVADIYRVKMLLLLLHHQHHHTKVETYKIHVITYS